MLTEIPDLLVWTRFASDFISLAHAHQEPPLRANNGAPWTTWLMLGGRGAGGAGGAAGGGGGYDEGAPPRAAGGARPPRGTGSGSPAPQSEAPMPDFDDDIPF